MPSKTSVVPALGQKRRVVLSAVEQTDNGYRLRLLVHGIGNHGAPLVMGETKAGADVCPGHATAGKQRQASHVSMTASV